MATANADIQAVLDRYVQAVRASDAGALMSLYADDVHVYDLMAPFERHGTENQRELMEAWLSSSDTEQDCRIEDLEIMQDGDLAVARASIEYSSKRDDGGTDSMWNRATWAFRRESGEWKIVLEHTSVPLGEEDMQPVFDRQQ